MACNATGPYFISYHESSAPRFLCAGFGPRLEKLLSAGPLLLAEELWLELDCREVRVCPLPEAEEESADEVDIADERYVGGSCGGGTGCAPPMPSTDPPSTEDVVTAACGRQNTQFR